MTCLSQLSAELAQEDIKKNRRKELAKKGTLAAAQETARVYVSVLCPGPPTRRREPLMANPSPVVAPFAAFSSPSPGPAAPGRTTKRPAYDFCRPVALFFPPVRQRGTVVASRSPAGGQKNPPISPSTQPDTFFLRVGPRIPRQGRPFLTDALGLRNAPPPPVGCQGPSPVDETGRARTWAAKKLERVCIAGGVSPDRPGRSSRLRPSFSPDGARPRRGPPVGCAANGGKAPGGSASKEPSSLPPEL